MHEDSKAGYQKHEKCTLSNSTNASNLWLRIRSWNSDHGWVFHFCAFCGLIRIMTNCSGGGFRFWLGCPRNIVSCRAGSLKSNQSNLTMRVLSLNRPHLCNVLKSKDVDPSHLHHQHSMGKYKFEAQTENEPIHTTPERESRYSIFRGLLLCQNGSWILY